MPRQRCLLAHGDDLRGAAVLARRILRPATEVALHRHDRESTLRHGAALLPGAGYLAAVVDGEGRRLDPGAQVARDPPEVVRHRAVLAEQRSDDALPRR